MDTARARLVEVMRHADAHRRFRLYHPVTTAGRPIYVHAKILIVDDRVLHVGSSNMNNRSLRLDTECDVMIDAASAANAARRRAGDRGLRDRLLGEHLGVAPASVRARVEAEGSLIAAIEALRGEGRSLRPYQVPVLNEVETWLADNELLDPEGPEEIFKPLSQRGLLRRLRHRFRRPRRSLAQLQQIGRPKSKWLGPKRGRLVFGPRASSSLMIMSELEARGPEEQRASSLERNPL